jgi:hypothetical protein
LQEIFNYVMLTTMPNREALRPIEATDKLIQQFNIEGGVFAELEADGESPDKIATELTALVATTFKSCLGTPAAEIEYLAAWRQSLREDCSARFRQLQREDPLLSKVELNQYRDLLVLNGIRRGVHRAIADMSKRIKPAGA